MLVDDDVFTGPRSSLLSFRPLTLFFVMQVMNFKLKGGLKLLTHVCMQISMESISLAWAEKKTAQLIHLCAIQQPS